MSLIDQRNTDIGIIEGRFIEASLKEYGDRVMRGSKKVMKQRGFSNPIWNRASVSVSQNVLDYDVALAQRFVDMKTRTAQGHTKGTRKIPAGKKKKKHYPVHNKIVMGHKKHLVRTLSFGFTEEIKQQYRILLQNENSEID